MDLVAGIWRNGRNSWNFEFSFVTFDFLGLSRSESLRNLIRSSTEWASLHARFLLLLALGVFVRIGLWGLPVGRIYGESITKSLGILSLFLLIDISTFLIGDSSFNFRFWGRHLAKIIPAFLADYRKNDYPEAVKCAVVAAGPQRAVLWATRQLTGSYYGDLFSSRHCRNFYRTKKYQGIDAINWHDTQMKSVLKSSQLPIIVVVSKPEIFNYLDGMRKSPSQMRPQLIASFKHSAFRKRFDGFSVL